MTQKTEQMWNKSTPQGNGIDNNEKCPLNNMTSVPVMEAKNNTIFMDMESIYNLLLEFG